MNPRSKVTPAHGSQLPGSNGAHKSATVQPKSAGAQQARRPAAPPVYKPLPVPKVLQTKMSVNHQPVNQPGRARPVPAAPPIYRPQPVPKVLQAKQTKAGGIWPGAPMNRKPAASVNGDARLKSVHKMPTCHGAAIQRATNVNYSRTQVKATAGQLSATGQSGRSWDTQNLLTTIPNPAALEFKDMLDERVKPKLVKTPKGGSVMRGQYDCAEPNAVARLLKKNKNIKLSQIKISTASDSFGEKMECPVCSQWIDHGKIVEPVSDEVSTDEISTHMSEAELQKSLWEATFGSDTTTTQTEQKPPTQKLPELNDTNFPPLGGK